jgi:hypothetical protein
LFVSSCLAFESDAARDRFGERGHGFSGSETIRSASKGRNNG